MNALILLAAILAQQPEAAPPVPDLPPAQAEPSQAEQPRTFNRDGRDGDGRGDRGEGDGDGRRDGDRDRDDRWRPRGPRGFPGPRYTPRYYPRYAPPAYRVEWYIDPFTGQWRQRYVRIVPRQYYPPYRRW